MQFVVTGGGTGGHVYPALEVARELVASGAEGYYFGSLRGHEVAASSRAGLPFTGYRTFPLVSIRTPAGIRAYASMVKAIPQAVRDLRKLRPDVVFSTGGYSSGPVMWAAHRVGIPLAIHACDSVPGRALRMHAERAKGFTCSFRSTADHLRRLGLSADPIRTGQPIRASLRVAVQDRAADPELAVVLGGSQGSLFLNEIALAVRDRISGRMTVSVGKGHGDRFAPESNANVEFAPYFEAERMGELYRTAGVAIARSGGTIAEFAMARLPSILIPLPTSADDHQRHNGMEFVEMGAADLLIQPSPANAVASPSSLSTPIATPEALLDSLGSWRSDPNRRARAEAALAEWDVPDASARIAAIVRQAAQK